MIQVLSIKWLLLLTGAALGAPAALRAAARLRVPCIDLCLVTHACSSLPSTTTCIQPCLCISAVRWLLM